jgi:signal-transduction protein with cAMP-binding, CBS, and nucleotidyltransferase domain
MRIKDVMNKAIAIDHDMTIKEAAKIMSDKNIGSLIVVDDDRIKGIITERDVLHNITDLGKKVSNVIGYNVITIDEDETIDEAALIMSKNKIRRLPVTEDGKLVGMITSTDLIAHAEDLGEEFLLD